VVRRIENNAKSERERSRDCKLQAPNQKVKLMIEMTYEYGAYVSPRDAFFRVKTGHEWEGEVGSCALLGVFPFRPVSGYEKKVWL